LLLKPKSMGIICQWKDGSGSRKVTLRHLLLRLFLFQLAAADRAVDFMSKTIGKNYSITMTLRAENKHIPDTNHPSQCR
jgi:hypothetical protein